MAYSPPATVVTGTTITSTWGNSVKTAVDYVANAPTCRVFHNTTNSITSGTEMTLAFNSEAHKNVAGMHSNVTNNSRITITDAGVYAVSWGFQLSLDTDYTMAYSYLRLNGTTIVGWGSAIGTYTSGATAPMFTGSSQYKFAANDYIELRANQANTSAGANTTQANTTFFAATWVSLG